MTAGSRWFASLTQKGTDPGMAERTNHSLLHGVPADRTVLQSRKTDTRNGGTSTALSVMGPHTQRGCA
jgi:hypothetical protein